MAGGLLLFSWKQKGCMRKPTTHFEQVPLTAAIKAIARAVATPAIVKPRVSEATTRKPVRKAHR